jgi:hypothetical protein
MEKQMEIKVQLPFQALLELVKSLSPAEKKKLKKELENEGLKPTPKDDFMAYLLNGPVYSEAEIAQIEENHKSIAAWRTKD